MRKLKVGALVSLDGVTDDPRSWASAYFDEDATERSIAQLDRSHAMLMGRATYEYFRPAWSVMSGPYADRINAIRKYVFSSTLRAVDWSNAVLVPGDAVGAVRELKREGGDDLVLYGFGRLARSLLGHGLVDELDLWIHPVVLDGGTRVRLSAVERRPPGVVSLTYTQNETEQEA